MDLLATVRKEGSRGGRGDFKWSDVQNSARREHYLGHSLMAPVGRWAKGRDLNWYAKGDGQTEDGEDPAQKAERERKEEIQRVKEAEEDALARALGLPVPPRNNANMEPVSDKRHPDQPPVEPSFSNSHIGRADGGSRAMLQSTQGGGIEGTTERTTVVTAIVTATETDITAKRVLTKRTIVPDTETGLVRGVGHVIQGPEVHHADTRNTEIAHAHAHDPRIDLEEATMDGMSGRSKK